MVFIQFQRPVNTDELMRKLKSDGIIANPPNNGVMRLVTHYYIDPEMVKKTADVLSKALA
jgi:threonine aldolase